MLSLVPTLPSSVGSARFELRHLRYFVAVAEELHFGHAAKKLHISQPPLSRQIRELEVIIGKKLLNRTSRETTLTQAGIIFLKHSRHILRQAENAISAIHEPSIYEPPFSAA